MAAAAYASDLSNGHAKASSSSSTIPAAAPAHPPPAKKTALGGPSNPFANYTTAAQLGITDPDADRQAVEAIMRQSQGRAGQWSIVTPVASTSATNQPSTSSRKRDREAGKDDQQAEDDDERRFRMKKKMVAVGLGEDIWDAGEIKLKPKVEPKSEEVDSGASGLRPGETQATEKPAWVSRGWKKAGENVAAGGDGEVAPPADPLGEGDVKEGEEVSAPQGGDEATGGGDEVKLEEDNAQPPPPPRPPSTSHVKEEPPTNSQLPPPPPDEPAPSGGMFKKRKAPATVGPKKGARRQL